MFSRWTFGKRLGGGFAAAGIVLVAIAAAGYRTTLDLLDSQRWVIHTHDVRAELAHLLCSISEAESGERGYVITAREEYLGPHREALNQVERSFEQVRRLTADNPRQQGRLDELRAQLDARIEHLRTTIEQRRSSGFEASTRVILEGGGKRAMDEIQRIAAAIDREERELLDERLVAAEHSARITEFSIAWGSALGLLLIAAIGFLIGRSLSAQIGGVVQHIESSSAELHAAANQQVTGARHQALAMSEIATTVSELLATSREIDASAQRVSEIAELTADAARSGDGTVEKGSESSAGIRRSVDVIVHRMLELGKKSQHIGAVLEIVSELAEQTNLLAINATIEAVGAGDAGKRFSVVADEIRKLADRVAGSTKEIRDLIDEVRGAVNTTVMTTETASKAVENGSAQFGEVASAFQRIAAQVKTTAEAAKEIGMSTKQQATAVEQVKVAIGNVSQLGKEAEVSTEQTLQTASGLTDLSRELLEIVRPQSKLRARARA